MHAHVVVLPALLTLLSASLSLAQTPARERKRDAKLDPAYVAAYDAAMPRARVWAKPEVPIGEARLDQTPRGDDGFADDAVVECRFKPEGVGGSTPKFVCELPNGDDFKVKYGASNEEVFTEVLATRLLHTLGFPADRMYPVAKVRCTGCSADPFKELQCLNDGTAKEVCFGGLDATRVREFDHAVIERSMDGRRIETRKARGWDWKDLSAIDPALGGSPRAHVDALRLMAVFLAHWDNKAKNQRLLCAGENESDPNDRAAKAAEPANRGDAAAEPCDEPIAMVQDVGGTFGPPKLNLANWSKTPIWSGATASCVVSMRSLPYGGSAFADVEITEEGRQFLVGLLGQLSRQQIQALFTGARVTEYQHPTAAVKDVDGWVRAFEQKVASITQHAPCSPAAERR